MMYSMDFKGNIKNRERIKKLMELDCEERNKFKIFYDYY